MYPFIRFAAEAARARRLPPLALDEAHVSRHRVLPWDLDPWRELNNGRTLTIYDMGRIGLMTRTGIARTLRREGWGAAVAGASIRYRKRVHAWQRMEVRSRLVGRCERFFYFHQTAWRGGEPLSAVLIRTAVTASGIVRTDEVVAAHGAPDWRPTLPLWVQAWIEAERERPWPPEA